MVLGEIMLYPITYIAGINHKYKAGNSVRGSNDICHNAYYQYPESSNDSQSRRSLRPANANGCYERFRM